MWTDIDLIGITETVDAYGDHVKTETRRTVLADDRSVGMTETYQAMAVGFKPSMEFRVWQFEYSDEKVVEYDGTRYAVYRTYKAPDGRMELYTEDRVGEEVQD